MRPMMKPVTSSKAAAIIPPCARPGGPSKPLRNNTRATTSSPPGSTSMSTAAGLARPATARSLNPPGPTPSRERPAVLLPRRLHERHAVPARRRVESRDQRLGHRADLVIRVLRGLGPDEGVDDVAQRVRGSDPRLLEERAVVGVSRAVAP